MSNKLKYLFIHCTATQEGNEISSATIRRWHTAPKPEGRGWKQVGYTKMLHLDGTWEQLVGNNEDDIVDNFEITNGAAGYNSISQHWVYVGGLDNMSDPKDTRTEKQKEALKKAVIEFHAKFPHVIIKGHNEVANKACPSFDVQKWLLTIGIRQ
jgi:hypothetical protein